jgi:light-regulated signal transduction histidine kinase (bacteriophytochrome)
VSANGTCSGVDPLIVGFAGMLEESLPPERSADVQHFLAVIRDNATLLNTQIDALLTLSRLEHRPLRRSPVDMTAMAHEIVAATRDREPDRPVAARVGALPVTVADPELMRTALTELVRNAWKFTRTRAAPEVDLGGESRNGETVYFIRDNGVGFSPDSADRLFTVFRRLHSPKEYDGLGVGLATVRSIVTRHGGRAWAECGGEPTRTTFWFALPAE